MFVVSVGYIPMSTNNICYIREQQRKIDKGFPKFQFSNHRGQNEVLIVLQVAMSCKTTGRACALGVLQDLHVIKSCALRTRPWHCVRNLSFKLSCLVVRGQPESKTRTISDIAYHIIAQGNKHIIAYYN